MGCPGRRDFSAHLCGLCLALGKHHGTLARAAVNTDAALVSLIAEAQSAVPLPRVENRCPGNGFRPVRTLSPDHPVARFTASLSLFIGAVRVEDHLADGDLPGGVLLTPLFGIARRWRRSAEVHFSRLGFDSKAAAARIRKQSTVERIPGGDFRVYAAATEFVAAQVCRHTGVLMNRPRNEAALAAFGGAFGRIIFLLDHYRDYRRDRKSGAFNALAQRHDAPAVQEAALNIFHAAFTELRSAFSALSLYRTEPAASIFLHRFYAAGIGVFDEGPEMKRKKANAGGGENSGGFCCDGCHCCACPCDGCDCPCDGCDCS